MKGTKLSPGPSLLGGFPKQGLAKEKNQEQASRQQDMHMETSKPNPAAPGIQDTQANSQTPGRFLTKSKYQQSEGKGTCTENQAQHPAMDTTMFSHATREVLRQINLIEAKIIDCDCAMMHGSNSTQKDREALLQQCLTDLEKKR